MDAILEKALEKGLDGAGLSYEEAIEFTGLGDEHLFDMLSVSDRIRRHRKGLSVNLCSIVNAKSGLCSEDCSFCSQSARYRTGVAAYPMAEPEAIVESAKKAKARGAREFSIVASGARVEKDSDMDRLVAALEGMRRETRLERCASLGMLKKETLLRLKDAGLQSYHHNLETSRGFFPNVCTTHDYEDDVRTIRAAKELGFYVCSGGIFGIGESWEHRAELAFTLKELDVDSIPVNFLNPRPGTPLESAKNLTPLACLRIITLLRLVLPTKDIVVCGGRPTNLRDLQPLIFAAGANGMMIGDYLTTPGRDAKDDLRMIEDMGLVPRQAHD